MRGSPKRLSRTRSPYALFQGASTLAFATLNAIGDSNLKRHQELLDGLLGLPLKGKRKSA